MTDLKRLNDLKELAYRKSIRCDNFLCDKKPEEGQKFKTCGKCRVSHYCSPECQKAHWKNHKMYCEQLGSKRDIKQWIHLTNAFIEARKEKLREYAKILSKTVDKVAFLLHFDSITVSIHEPVEFLGQMLKIWDDESLKCTVKKNLDGIENVMKEDEFKKLSNKETFYVTFIRGEGLIDTHVMSMD